MKYAVDIEEVFIHPIIVEANSEQEALLKAEKKDGVELRGNFEYFSYTIDIMTERPRKPTEVELAAATLVKVYKKKRYEFT